MEKIKKLRQIIKKKLIDGYLVTKNDEFFGEYIPDQSDRLKYISNFSGSFGFALILKTKNYLFVDGRYTLQAKNQCGKSFIVLTFPQKMPYNFLKNKNFLVGYDPKLVSSKILNTFFSKSKCKLVPIKDNLIDKIWKRKIKKNKGNFYSLPKKSVGNYYKFKINKVVSHIKRKGADFQFISASENNAWLLNIRGNDAEYSPIPTSYILINKDKKIILFCNLDKIPLTLKRNMRDVKFLEIDKTSKVLSGINGKKFLIDGSTCSIFFEKVISKNNKIIDFQDSIYDFKSIKSKKEIRHIQKSHIYDGVALTKYLFWLKKNFLKKNITEISGAKKLFNFRKKNKNFKFSSFPTISGTGPNGAIIHYKANKKTNRTLTKGDIYLVDSGGQYNFGTTDVTRTISLKNTSARIKNIFTRVLKGHIAVANYNLKKNTTGSIIDKSARKYLKKINLDYAHGTGHGVGYFLNVHEGPNGISKNNLINFKEGMVVSNEPGYYEKNNFGIRIENLLFVKKKKQKIFFENLTMTPIDKELIEFGLLNKKERNWLNSYHKKIFFKLSKFMNKMEYLELKKACSAI